MRMVITIITHHQARPGTKMIFREEAFSPPCLNACTLRCIEPFFSPLNGGGRVGGYGNDG